MQKTNHLLTNPFVLYGVTWIFVLLLYSLPWSNLLPELKIELIFFFLITSIISLIFGLFFHKRKYFSFQPFIITNNTFLFFKRVLYGLYILLLIEFILERNIPFVSYFFLGAESGAYLEFGVPFLHVFIVNGFSYLFLLSGHAYLSASRRDQKKTLLLLMVFSLLPGLLVFNRALIMFSLFGYALLYLMSKKGIILKLLGIGVISIVILYLFGLMGSFRNATGIESGRYFILKITKATPEFISTGIPSEYLWTYIYIVSPVGNLQNTINNTMPNECSISNFPEYIINELTPMVFSKRVGLEVKEGKLIVPYLNVGSVYMGAYSTLGWFGMIFTYIFSIFLIFFFIFLVPKSSPYFVTLVILLCMITFFNLFDNMFIFMGIAPQLVLPVLFDSANKYLNK